MSDTLSNNITENSEEPPESLVDHNTSDEPANNVNNNGPIRVTRPPLTQATTATLSEGRRNLRKWLGKTFRIVISDGRVLVGYFNCTDKDANVVMSMCSEYLEEGKEARVLGNVMIPGKHIVSVSVDMPKEEADWLHDGANKEASNVSSVGNK